MGNCLLVSLDHQLPNAVQELALLLLVSWIRAGLDDERRLKSVFACIMISLSVFEVVAEISLHLCDLV